VGVTFLGETFTLGMGLGFPLILVGSVLGARRVADAVDAPEPGPQIPPVAEAGVGVAELAEPAG
jgi:hypothetical protein